MRCKKALATVLFLSLPAVLTPARAGHEFPYYPSFYPHEIRVEAVTPGVAARRLQRGSLHAFIGEDLYRAGKIPNDVGFVDSLGAYVVATVDGPSVPPSDRDHRCALIGETLSLLAGLKGYVFHPYPVTPYHADYLQHFDLVEAPKNRYLRGPVEGTNSTKVRPRLRARGVLAERLIGTYGRSSLGEWDVTIEGVDIGGLISAHGTRFDGWSGPPWLKEGWYQAYLLLAERIRDKAARQNADALAQGLMHGDHKGLEEKLNLERRLIALLTHSCEAVVVGYAVRREYFNSGFSTGIENVAFDSHTGFNSSIFIRTAKLKDFPWNGWLRLGIHGWPVAAWNPIGGFTDPFGRLVWSAVGDPALLQAPYGSGWIANRITVSVPEDPGWQARLRSWLYARIGRAGVISVPRDALIPEPGSGRLRRVGTGKEARARIVYSALTSAFHDGSLMSVGDALYPYVMAFAWGGEGSREGAHDRAVEKSTALMRARLVAFRVARIDRRVVTLGDIKQTWENPVVEVYLRTASADGQQATSVAPPWAGVPWHVMALMEEAVKRRVAAFSKEEARRRDVEWLDLVRRPAVNDRLAGLVEEFSVRGYVPEALKGFVTAEQARGRWRGLKRFYQKHGHFLVTNGPYRLEKWTQDAVTLSVFRDLSYPLGIGSFDGYPVPRTGYITAMNVLNGRLQVRADVETIEKFSRRYRIVREPLTDTLMPGALNKVRPVCRYVVIGSDGRVVKAGAAEYAGSGTFAADLNTEPASLLAIVAAVYVDENDTNPRIRVLRPGR